VCPLGNLIKVSARVPEELVTWLDAQVVENRRAGKRSDRSSEIVVALNQRRISLMTKTEREELFKKLGV